MAQTKVESKEDDESYRKINEKERGQTCAPFELSNVLHSSFGIDHYPNYLYR